VAGTHLGGKSAAKTSMEKYGKDFYRRIGALGGRKGRTGGFFANRELARIAGAKGGRISRRKPVRIERPEKPTDNHSPDAGGSFGFTGR
jgi:hypothetical protein